MRARRFSGSEEIARNAAATAASQPPLSAIRQGSAGCCADRVAAARESVGFASESPRRFRFAEPGNEAAQLLVVAEHVLEPREDIVGHVLAGAFPRPDAVGLQTQRLAHLVGCRSGADHPHRPELLEAQ